MRRLQVVLILSIAFASTETALVILSTALVAGSAQTSAPSSRLFFWTYASQLSILGWTVAGVTFLSGRSGRGTFARQGFGGDIYKLMVKMRGSAPRLSLLRNLEEPRHRYDLARVTGMDWKEVDRQLKVLENYGLVRLFAQSGTVRLYQITQQGRVLLKLIDDLTSQEKAQ